MFRSILVTLCHESERSPVVPQAIWLAKRARATLLGLYVVDKSELSPPPGIEGISPAGWRAVVERELRGIGQKLIKGFTSQCERAGVQSESRIVTGPLVPTICRHVQTADLVVMGCSGDYIRRPGVLTCAPLEGVVREASRPVLVAAAEPRPIRRILVAYDAGDRASAALRTAAQLAGEWQIPLLLLTVLERGVGREALAEGQTYCQVHGLPARALLRKGMPAAEILRACREEDVDLLVIGAYCHGRVQELIFGGTVGHIVHNADCPVLIDR